MSPSIRLSTACLIGITSIGLIGCGGNGNSVSLTPPTNSTTPPTSLSIEANTALDATNLVVTADIAVRGPRIIVGVDQNTLNTVWVGNKKFYFSTALNQASLSSANFNYAVGSYSGGSLIWPYRSGGQTIAIAQDSVYLVAKNADIFFDSGYSSDGSTQIASLIKIKSGKPVLVPYNLPQFDSNSLFMSGVSINAKGLAVINLSANPLGPTGKNRPSALARRAIWNKVAAPILGTHVQKLATIRSRFHPSTTLVNLTGYYIVSTTGNPISIGLPDGSLGIAVIAINDKGVSVGVSYVGDPNNPDVIPYYWDANGNAFPIPITSDLNFGFPTDINSEGAVVGEAGSTNTGFAAMWNTVTSMQTNLNTLTQGASKYVLYSGDSIGDDFDIAASGTTANGGTDPYYFGLH